MTQPSGARRGLVLVVDDDPIVLEVVRERLESAGFEVETRDQALGTSGWIAEKQPDAVLLDVMMPALSGSEIANLLSRRELTQKTAVIFHSSMSHTLLDEVTRSAGAVGLIQKTSDARRFILEFERLLARFKAGYLGNSSLPPLPLSSIPPKSR
jgi:response regulator NasT